MRTQDIAVETMFTGTNRSHHDRGDNWRAGTTETFPPESQQCDPSSTHSEIRPVLPLLTFSSLATVLMVFCVPKGDLQTFYVFASPWNTMHRCYRPCNSTTSN